MFKDENAKKVDTISAIISQKWRMLSTYFGKNEKKNTTSKPMKWVICFLPVFLEVFETLLVTLTDKVLGSDLPDTI